MNISHMRNENESNDSAAVQRVHVNDPAELSAAACTANTIISYRPIGLVGIAPRG